MPKTRCGTCNNEFDNAMFIRDKYSKTGIKNLCKECAKKRTAEHRKRRRALRSREEAYAAVERKKCSVCDVVKNSVEFTYDPNCSDWLMHYCKECQAKRAASRRSRWTDSRKRAERDKLVRRLYGITAEMQDAMLSFQRRVCAICGVDESEERFGLYVDHDHDTGETRGLLCSKCNTALGGFRDSRELLDRAIEYLDLPPARRMKESSALSEEAA